MIRSKAGDEGAQRELHYLKDFLTRTEDAPDHPDKELGLISIYKRLYHLWDELEEYYVSRLAEAQRWESKEPPIATVSAAHSD
jgi:hypothetical protein